MDINAVLTPIRQICGIAAVIIAAIALIKLAGLGISIRASTIDLASVGILCALAGQVPGPAR